MLPRESFLALSFIIIMRKTLSLALSLLSGLIHSRKKKPAGSIGGKMPKTVVMLRRILTVIIPFIYIFFVTGTFILLWYMHTVQKYIYQENTNTGQERKSQQREKYVSPSMWELLFMSSLLKVLLEKD
jgi:hypothetical protein